VTSELPLCDDLESGEISDLVEGGLVIAPDIAGPRGLLEETLLTYIADRQPPMEEEMMRELYGTPPPEVKSEPEGEGFGDGGLMALLQDIVGGPSGAGGTEEQDEKDEKDDTTKDALLAQDEQDTKEGGSGDHLLMRPDSDENLLLEFSESVLAIPDLMIPGDEEDADVEKLV